MWDPGRPLRTKRFILLWHLVPHLHLPERGLSLGALLTRGHRAGRCVGYAVENTGRGLGVFGNESKSSALGGI